MALAVLAPVVAGGVFSLLDPSFKAKVTIFAIAAGAVAFVGALITLLAHNGPKNLDLFGKFLAASASFQGAIAMILLFAVDEITG